MARVKDGLVNPTPKLEFQEKTPVAAHLDGQNAFGFVVATKAMADAVCRAETYGIGIVTVNHSNHFGMAATYVLQALEKGMISLVFTNSAKQMPPFGGVETLLGISPFAAGAPSEKEVPFILDMAPSVVAKGKIRKAARRGESIPLGWAYDKDGKPTTDAETALNGSMAPIGGPKGSGIAILMDHVWSTWWRGFWWRGGGSVQGEEATERWPDLHCHQARYIHRCSRISPTDGHACSAGTQCQACRGV